MRRILIFLLSFIIGILLFVWVIRWVGWKEIKEILSAFSGWEGVAILGITFLIWAVGVWKHKFIYKSQGYNLPAFSLGEILLASFAITYLFPTSYFGGEAFKLYGIKKKFSLPWDKNITAFTIEKLVSLSVILLFLVVGVISFFLLASPLLRNFGLICFVFIGSLITGLTIFYFKSFKKESILKWFLKIFRVKERNHLIEDIEKDVFHFFDFRKILMWKGLGIAFLRNLLILIRCWFLISFLMGNVSIFVALAVLFFTHLSYLFPLPAKLGGLEVTEVFVFGSLGLGAATGISFSFLLRGVEIIVSLLGLIFLLKLGIRFFMGSVEDKINNSPANK